SIRLIETHGASHSYATLSYCWGIINSQWLCNKQTVDQYLLGIDREILPATLRDSIVIAASLGIRYIWIDALCIIQDSTSHWAAESAKMGSIYHGSLVTIAAAGSSDSNGGLYHPGPLRDDLALLESRLQSGSISRLYVVRSAGYDPYDDIYEEEVLHSLLSTRAWVFQEQVLSRRIIYYAQSQLFWECEHCRLSEDGCPQQQAQQIYPILASQKPLSTAQIIKSWYLGAVQTYTNRSLTHKHDKLVAISAVARATYLNRRIDYFAGLWKDCILQGLVWKRSSLGNKSRTYVCPSWLWASQDSSVQYDAIYNEPNKYIPYQPKVLEVHVDRDPKNHFGDVSSGYVKLDTWITSGWVLRSHAYELNHEQEFIFYNKSHLHIWRATVVMDDDDYTGPGVTVAMISNYYQDWVALVLESLSDGTQTYRRIGILKWKINDRHKIENPGQMWKQEFITIV
ncbi:HET-domain-containing protein, partial [Macroventuria anomochaeta]